MARVNVYKLTINFSLGHATLKLNNNNNINNNNNNSNNKSNNNNNNNNNNNTDVILPILLLQLWCTEVSATEAVAIIFSMKLSIKA